MVCRRRVVGLSVRGCFFLGGGNLRELGAGNLKFLFKRDSTQHPPEL